MMKEERITLHLHYIASKMNSAISPNSDYANPQDRPLVRVPVSQRGKFFTVEEHVPQRATLAILRNYQPMGDIAAVAGKQGISQREFLLAALYVCGYSRSELAQRLGCSKKGLEKWMANVGAADYHAMSPVVWKFVAEIMLQHKPELGARRRPH